MNIGQAVIKRFSSKQKSWAGGIVFIIELIAITPLCGLIFQCGCDWPWFGLDEKCNFYQSQIKHQCPWCVSMLMGGLSLLIVMITGIYVSTLSCLSLSKQSLNKEVFVRVMWGLVLFVLVAIIMGVMVALWQNYPLPSNHFLNE